MQNRLSDLSWPFQGGGGGKMPPLSPQNPPQHTHVHTVFTVPADPFSSIGGFTDDPFKTPTATTFGGSGGFPDPFAVS